MRSTRTLAAIALLISLGACSERDQSGLAGPGMTRPHFYGGGESGRSGAPGDGLCSNCHRGDGAAPTVTLSGPGALNPGQTGDYTLTIQPAGGSDQTQGGLNVAVPGGGTLIAGSGTEISSGEIVQSSPQRGTGTLSWSFQWQAPSAGGTYNMYGVGLSTDGNGTGGDEESTDMLAITVQAGNSPPSADSRRVETDMNTAATIMLSGSDAETCDLTFAIVSGPSSGSLGGISDQACGGGGDQAQVTYTPDTDYSGSDQFTYSATDADGATAEATVEITVIDPTAVDYSLLRVRARVTKDTKLEAAFIIKNNGNRQQGQAPVELYVDDSQGTGPPVCTMMAADEPGKGSTAFWFSPANGCDVPLHGKGAPAEFEITIIVKDQSPDSQTEKVKVRRISNLQDTMSAIEKALRGGG
jgi:hypothetical protein